MNAHQATYEPTWGCTYTLYIQNPSKYLVKICEDRCLSPLKYP